MATTTYRNQTFDVNGNLLHEEIVEVDPTPPTEAERLDVVEPLVLPPRDPTERERYDQLRAGYSQAMTDLRTIRNSSGTLTGAQLSNAIRVVARVQIAMLRLLARNFDGVD